MKKIDESEEVKFKDAEFLANRIIEVFQDKYPKEKETIQDIGKVEGVICYILGSKGFLRFNSEVLEVNKLSYILFQDAQRMEAYKTLNILTGMKDFRGREKND